MDHIRYARKKHAAKQSRLLPALALLLACALPFILVKTFSNRKSSMHTSKPLTLPRPSQRAELVEKSKKESAWTVVTAREKDTLGAIFNREGISAKTLQAVLQDNPHARSLTSIKPNQQLQLLVRDNILQKIIFPLTTTQFLVVWREGDRYRTKINTRKMNSHSHYVTATVNGSLYGTAKRLNIPYRLVHQMTEIFNWQIDFARDVRAGDRFTIIYKAFYIEDKQVGTGEIEAVSYTNRGKVYQAIRHVNANGDAGYFTPEGNGLQKAFSRYPINFSHISSTFSMNRFHPILRYNRPHKGVDLAARIGTPIHATGDGRVEWIGRHSGYGNMIKIKHDRNMSSLYAHMLKFQKGLARGARVKRGQVIGYVGQSGLASGPHCHYEFRINDTPRNPTTVDLPRSASVPAREMTAFRASAMTLLAHLKLFEDARIASEERGEKQKKA